MCPVKIQMLDPAGLVSGYRSEHLNTWLMDNSEDKRIDEQLRRTSSLQHFSLC